MVAGASVRTTNVCTGVTLTTRPPANGQFAFPGHTARYLQDCGNGQWVPSVTTDNVSVTAGAVYTLPVKLKVGETSTSVEVSAAALSIDTTTATQDNILPTQAVQGRPQ